ncbi:hypothetical protein AAZX31_19G232700 [Glycine max]
MSAVAPPYQLLEINVVSAQELAQVSKSVRAYAKFVFRVDDNFLNSDNSVIMVEIYSHAWLRQVLIGTVAVLVTNLLPPNRKPKLRFVALQIRRPSGRPQGILNIGINLLDSTMRSMPLYSELSSSAVGYWDNIIKNKNAKTEDDDDDNTQHHHLPLDSSLLTLQRCQSEKNDSTVNDYAYHGNAKHYGYDGQDSDEGVRKGGPSVVAAAIAKGLLPMPPPAPCTSEISGMDGWSENSGTEGMKTKIERWRNELTPAYEDYDDERKKVMRKTSKRVGQTSRRRGRGGGPCSCFGSVFGIEISITCGGGNRRKGQGGGKGRVTTASSELTYDDSYI